MKKDQYTLLLADDDEDDIDLFQEALTDLSISGSLVTVNDGVQLMEYLSDNLPDILFLDLNMPLKSGLECLTEIKSSDRLKKLPIVIFSTSIEMDMADTLYENGASYYVQKPNEFAKLKNVIENSLSLITKDRSQHSTRDQFILQSRIPQ
ncbi:MAG: response regulator [Sediminicola sp.]|tara:strand:+ start:5531 stop:5980 length:450 start_codon:yes stop_codon:yes gene_type:complete